MLPSLKHIFKYYFEILAFSIGLVLLATMDPETASGPGFCILERLGVTFCPGDGLGHSIAYIFQGEIYNALETNVFGPLAIIVLGGRIVQLLFKNYHINKNNYYGSND